MVMGIRFKEIRLQNFGPYYGVQSLLFSAKNPIVLVHGPNMAGKTSLLNAVRWVLYSHALNRFGKIMLLKQLINIDASKIGDWVMSVELDFEVDDIQYNLERRIQLKDSSIIPRTDNDFEMKCFLKKKGNYLDSEEVQTEINRIFPEQISRFFLFDGELLNEYETLLAKPEKQGSIIKESIEHILGVPAIVNALADIRTHLRDAARRQQSLAEQDQKAKTYAALAASIAAKIATQEQDFAKLQSQQDDLIKRQKELDDFLETVVGIEVDVQRLQDFEAQVARLREEQRKLKDENRDKLVDGWRDILLPTIQKRLIVLEAENDKQIGMLQYKDRLQTELSNIQTILDSGICPVCRQRQIGTDYGEFQARKGQIEKELNQLQFNQELLTQTSESIRILRKFNPSNVMGTIVSNETKLLRISVDLTDLELKIDAINDRLKGHDKSEIARNRREHTDVTKDLGVIEKLISDKEQEISRLHLEASQNRAKISEVSGPELQRMNREVKLCEDLIMIFERSIERLRNELRKSVEQTATDIFRHLITDKTYKGLQINEHFGLTIIDADDREVQVRSAGAEQIVALSLIGALNRNAVRQGPIIMDTPFGRLDLKHRENILKFIPTLADQVTLLVHGGEIDRNRDLSFIKDQIDQEYQINHLSSHKSELVIADTISNS